MSSNDSIGSNITNTTDVYRYIYKEPEIFYFYSGVMIFMIVFGTLLNLWFLLAILCSRDTRSRLRNKIICNSLVLHLVDSVIILPFNVSRLLSSTLPNCIFYSVIHHLALIQDFIGNWLLVMLLVVFIAQIKGLNAKIKLTPRNVTLCTVGLMVVPWVTSLVLVPVIVKEHFKRPNLKCTFATVDAIQIFKSVDTAVPIFLGVLLMIIAVCLKYRRFTRGYSSESMQTELISRGPEIDDHIAYIVATAVCVFCDLFQLIYMLNFRTFLNYGYDIVVVIACIAFMMSHSRVILMPLPWLLLPDIRQRIRTWRPWNRPALGIDLILTFMKEEND